MSNIDDQKNNSKILNPYNYSSNCPRSQVYHFTNCSKDPISPIRYQHSTLIIKSNNNQQ